jgi:chromate reductase
VEPLQPEKPIRILGIAGSLRKNSFNKQLLQAATKLLPEAAQLELFGIGDIPLYNQDVEVSGIPEAVKRFKERIESADAILIATPEYNHSYPGILKNAIDWGSRPYGQNSFNGKPVAVISASPGTFGGVGAQDQLKQVLLALNMHLVSQPAVIVTSAHDKIDSDGNLTDSITTQFFTQLLANLVEFARKFCQPVKPLLASAISKR